MKKTFISDVALDDTGHLAVAVLNNNTIAILNLETFKSLKVQGPSSISLSKLDITPDGKIIACSGKLKSSLGNSSIFFYDTEGNQLSGSIEEFPGHCSKLSFSKDGNLLAIATGGRGDTAFYVYSIRIKASMVSAKCLFKDDDLFATPSSIDFDKNARIVFVTGLYEEEPTGGTMYLYGNDFKSVKVKEIAKPPDYLFADVSFSPDSKKIAVAPCFNENVSVFSGKTLSRLYYLNVSAMRRLESFEKVCWSSDGYFLYATSHWSSVRAPYFGLRHHRICKWSEAGKGLYKNLPLRNRYVGIKCIKSLKDGGIIYITDDLNVGVFNKDDKEVFYKRLPL